MKKSTVAAGKYMQLASQYWNLSRTWNNSATSSTGMSSGQMIDQLNDLKLRGIQVPEVYDRRLLGSQASKLLQEVIMGEGQLHPEASEVSQLIQTLGDA